MNSRKRSLRVENLKWLFHFSVFFIYKISQILDSKCLEFKGLWFRQTEKNFSKCTPNPLTREDFNLGPYYLEFTDQRPKEKILFTLEKP